jgi:rhodanese-related sulfurtransferase
MYDLQQNSVVVIFPILDALKHNLSKLDKSKPVITCCASGIRSASAKNILRSNGFEEVKNGGGWASLRRFEN